LTPGLIKSYEEINSPIRLLPVSLTLGWCQQGTPDGVFVFMKKILANEDFIQIKSRPENYDLREREITKVYQVIKKEMAEELETMQAQEALRLFKDVLLRLV
jgi:hypothetical protein